MVPFQFMNGFFSSFLLIFWPSRKKLGWAGSTFLNGGTVLTDYPLLPPPTKTSSSEPSMFDELPKRSDNV